MDRYLFQQVIEKAAKEKGCILCDVIFNDDDNVFEIVIDKDSEPVDIFDCEYIHRAVLTAFDRNIEDYSLTVSSKGIDAEEADEILSKE